MHLRFYYISLNIIICIDYVQPVQLIYPLHKFMTNWTFSQGIKMRSSKCDLDFEFFILTVNKHIESCQIIYFVVYIVFIFVYILCIYVLHCSYALLLKLSMGVITIITRPVNKSKSMVTDMLYWPQQYDRSPTQASYIWILTCYYYH